MKYCPMASNLDVIALNVLPMPTEAGAICNTEIGSFSRVFMIMMQRACTMHGKNSDTARENSKMKIVAMRAGVSPAAYALTTLT
jgi:hypothetical protein